MKVAQELKEAQIARQVGFAEAPKHPQIRLEQGEQALCPVLMHVTARIFLLRMVDKVVRIALQRAIAAGRVGVEATARLHREVSGLLHRLHGEVFGRLDDNSALATDPGDNCWPIFVVVPPTRFTLLTAPTCPASQVLFSAVFRLALLAGSVREVIGFDRAVHLTMHLVGQGRIAEPPAPAIARPPMHSQLPGNTARGTRQAQQKCREHPMHDRALATVQERAREVIEGALATLRFTPIALQPGLVVVGAPWTDVVALTPRTLEGP